MRTALVQAAMPSEPACDFVALNIGSPAVSAGPRPLPLLNCDFLRIPCAELPRKPTPLLKLLKRIPLLLKTPQAAHSPCGRLITAPSDRDGNGFAKPGYASPACANHAQR